MKQSTTKAALEKSYAAFEREVQASEPFWNVFCEIVLGNNYTSSIARRLHKNKAIVSRQLNRLHQLDVVVQVGAGVKQFYEVNWLTLTSFWIIFSNVFQEMVGNLKEWRLVPDLTPDWLSAFYITNEEEKIQGKKPLNVEPLLEPITPQLAEIVRRVLEVTSHSGNVRTFFDAFMEISVAFAAGLPDRRDIDPRNIDIPYNKQLIDTLYSPTVRLWLKHLGQMNLASSNIVRNYLLRVAGVIKTDEVAALRPQN